MHKTQACYLTPGPVPVKAHSPAAQAPANSLLKQLSRFKQASSLLEQPPSSSRGQLHRPNRPNSLATQEQAVNLLKQLGKIKQAGNLLEQLPSSSSSQLHRLSNPAAQYRVDKLLKQVDSSCHLRHLPRVLQSGPEGHSQNRVLEHLSLLKQLFQQLTVLYLLPVSQLSLSSQRSQVKYLGQWHRPLAML